MHARRLAALALLTTLALTPAAPARTAGVTARADDEREARELAVRLVGRLREADDFGPVVEEFFPADFAERLRQFVLSQPADSEAFAFCEHEAVARADASDLRRAYVALMNFWHQQDELGHAAWHYVKIEVAARGQRVNDDQDAWPRHYRLQKEAVPAEAFRMAAADPLLALLFEDFVSHGIDNEEVAGGGSEGRDEAEQDVEKFKAKYAIRDAARLRTFTEKLERCIPPLREAVRRLRSEMKALAAANAISDNPADYEPVGADPLHLYKLESETLQSATFGLPAGAILIRARVYPYEMALARLGDRLTVLAVYPDFDGD